MRTLLTRPERTALHRALRLTDLDRRRFAASVALGSLGTGSSVALAAVAAWLIARASQTPEVVALGVAPVAVRLFGISRSVLRYCERLVSHDTALRGMNGLRTRLYEILADARTDTVASLRRGDVLARVGTDVDAVGDLVVRAYLPMAVAASVSLLTCLGVGIVYPPAALVLALSLLASGVIGPLVTMRAARAAETARQEQSTDLSATVLTILDGGSELNVSGRMAPVMAGLKETENHLARTRDRAARPAALAAGIDVAAMSLAVLGNLLLGVPAVTEGRLAPVWLAVIVLLPLSAFEATAALGPASVQLVRSAGAAQRVVELVEQAEASTAQVPVHQELPASGSTGPCLRARDLAVGWPGGPVVAQGINLELAPGQRVAVVGPSGIGKTTLLLTLAGLLEPKSGELSLDGVPPWNGQRSEVASRVTLTAEDAHVFSTTVLENLRVANGGLTPDQALENLHRAGLGAWVTSLPEGLDTHVGSDAMTVSGGERRRLLLARALGSPAPLMLLDEPGEHLDPATADRLVADLLGSGTLAEGEARGVLLITHRLSALDHADEVLLMGRPGPDAPAQVVRRGSHTELVSQDPGYRWSLEQELLQEQEESTDE